MNDVYRMLLDGIVEINEEKYFALKCLQSPYVESEGKIQLIPYDENTRNTRNLITMFTPEPVFV